MFLSRRIFFYLPNNGVKAGGGLRTLSGGIPGTMASNASSAPVGNRGGRVSTSSPRYYPQKETLYLLIQETFVWRLETLFLWVRQRWALNFP
jgi:hypothetical protein